MNPNYILNQRTTVINQHNSQQTNNNGEAGGGFNPCQINIQLGIQNQYPPQPYHSLLNAVPPAGSTPQLSAVTAGSLCDTNCFGFGFSTENDYTQSSSNLSNEYFEQSGKSKIKQKYPKTSRINKKKQNRLKNKKRFKQRNSKKPISQYFRKLNKSDKELTKILKKVHTKAISLNCHFVIQRHRNTSQKFKEIMNGFRSFAMQKINKLDKPNKSQQAKCIIENFKRAIESSNLFEDGEELKSFQHFGHFTRRTDAIIEQLQFYLSFKRQYEYNCLISKQDESLSDIKKLKELIKKSSSCQITDPACFLSIEYSAKFG